MHVSEFEVVDGDKFINSAQRGHHCFYNKKKQKERIEERRRWIGIPNIDPDFDKPTIIMNRIN